jgi:predicted dinucleotide-binding enzyme
MKIGILGTGMVGQTLARDLSQAGHHVVLGTRDPTGKQAPEGVELVAPTAACDADLVINALNGSACLGVLTSLAGHLGDTILLDLTNPLDFSRGFPPTLFTEQDDSLAERIQSALPDTRVIKSLNTLNCELMLHPESLDGPSAVFVCGDDAIAKQFVTDLLTSFGWEQIIDLGGIQSARGVEMMMPMWLQLMQTLGGPKFNWAIVT